MSYQVLARKWRPGDFSEVAGQEHVLKTLINALDNQRLHHAYLFTGTRGTGKTTLARILAKCFNCEQGIRSNPCNACPACTEISEGRHLDLFEIDAASRTKVEDTRDLLENVQFAPARARFKVYLIDEVHMLSTHSFNALLKTLEEPPEHVKFLFATTDPQKLPVTILSRCLQFHLRNLGPGVIVKYLEPVLEQEKIACESAALWQIATAAAGSMRDALTLLDQAISYCQGSIHSDAVVEMLGIPPQQQVFALLQAMAAGDPQAVLGVSDELAGQIPDYVQTLDSLLSTLHRLAIAQAWPEAIDNHHGDRRQVIELAGEFSAEDLQLFYQIGNRGREELALPGDTRAAFEMLLLRMLVFSPEPLPSGAAPKMPDAASAPTATDKPGSEPEASPVSSAAPASPVRQQAPGPTRSAPDAGPETSVNVVPEPETAAAAPPAAIADPDPEPEPEPDSDSDPAPEKNSLVASFEQDPNVQALLRNFSGRVIPESVTLSPSRGES